MTYTIPETARENLTKTLEKYAKKAVRYGSSLNYSMSESFWQNFNARDEHGEYIGSFPVEVFNLDLEDSGIIKCGDYSVLAAIHHMDGGNIVNNFTGRRDVEWTRIAPKCEHCGTNHDRKITFIVGDKNGNTKQVGSSCLKDYSGIDPRMTAMGKEITEIILKDYLVDAYYDDDDHLLPKVWNTVSIFALAAKRFAEAGYVKSSEDNSNKSWIIAHADDTLTDEEMAAGKAIVDSLAAMSADEAIENSLNDARLLALQSYCKLSMFGYVAYAPVAFKRFEDKKKAAEKASESRYVGTIGEKWSGKVNDFHLLTHWDNGFGGTVYLYSFKDEDGNEMVWKASKGIQTASVSTLTGTVKEHKEYKGKAQTVLTRCKVA